MRGDYRRVFTERLNSIGPLEILSVARMTVVVKSSANLLAKLSWSERNEQAREELGPKLIQMHEQSCTCACTITQHTLMYLYRYATVYNVKYYLRPFKMFTPDNCLLFYAAFGGHISSMRWWA